jgi:glutamine synthetase
VLRPDFHTLRMLPWHEATALVLCDVEWVGGGVVPVSPRQVLRRQLGRLAERGLEAFVGTELEFIVFDDSYEQAWNTGYRHLTPANQYNLDYSMLGTGRIEQLLRRIRNSMAGAGMYVESAKGECNPGQQEIAFRYADALSTCDNHSIYKTGAKEIAAQDDKSLTFMAKYDQREGNSCHIHISLRDKRGKAVLAEDESSSATGSSKTMEHFLAGQLACLRELTYFFAPNINSYKRFVPGSFAPTTVAWGTDNRTCALRVVGHGESLRVENRVPGGDVNPYLAVAALIAAGLYGMDNALPLEPELAGNAYEAGASGAKPTVPTTLHEAAALLAGSTVAREAFGDDVVEHYLNAARVETAAFDAAVTDWERVRGFERL